MFYSGFRHFLDASTKLATKRAGLTISQHPLSTSNSLC